MVHKHRLRLVEVPVAMRSASRASSITALALRLLHGEGLLAIFVGLSGNAVRWRSVTQTPLKVSIAASLASLLLLVVVFELIRSRRLRERYASSGS